ncbi:MAG TPA: thioredoxin family protein [Variovorax sp.]|nr:thioredoxin family protein [Variovorax sp.]
MNFQLSAILLAVALVASAAALGFAVPPRAAADGTIGEQKAAPAFEGIDTWINASPLTLDELKGKVVLVDFWTYTCINCLDHLPYVKDWYAKYKDQGLVVVGVHTPEFAFEKSTANVQAAVTRLKIPYAVAQDNQYATWKAFDNHFWPAIYLIDRQGHVVYSHFGEGRYAQTERKIQSLLAQPAPEKS